MSERPDYGVDGYPFIAALVIATALLLVAAGFAMAWESPRVGASLAASSLVPFALAALGLRYVWVGKFELRDRLLGQVEWKGNERSLDVGTGGGLMLIGAAQRAPRGRATGIDIWNPGDLSGNGPERAQRNADLEHVHERIEIIHQDAQKMAFGDASFDVVLSVLCIHNIAGAAGRDAAVREMARVLRPGGVLLLADLAHTARYARVLRDAGLTVTRSGVLMTFPPQRLVEARKP